MINSGGPKSFTCFSSALCLGALDQRLVITEIQKDNETDALSSHRLVQLEEPFALSNFTLKETQQCIISFSVSVVCQ